MNRVVVGFLGQRLHTKDIKYRNSYATSVDEEEVNLPDLTKGAYYAEFQYCLRKVTVQFLTLWLFILGSAVLFLLAGLIPVLGQGLQLSIGTVLIGLLLAVPLRIATTFYQVARYIWFHHRPPYNTTEFTVTLNHNNQKYQKRFATVTDRASWTASQFFWYGILWLSIIGVPGEFLAPHLDRAIMYIHHQYPNFISGSLLFISDIVGVRILAILEKFGDPKTIAGLSVVILPMAFFEAISTWNILFYTEQKWIHGSKIDKNGTIIGLLYELGVLLKWTLGTAVLSVVLLLIVGLLG